MRDYNKVLGYAFLYASFMPVDVLDLTVSFAVTVHPRDLLAYLKNDRKLAVVDNGRGVYRIDGEAFPVQILESKKLPKEENLFLKNLRSSLNANDAQETTEAYGKLKDLEFRNAYLDKLMRANRKAFEEAMEVSVEAKEINYGNC